MPTKFISVKNPANGNIGTMSETAFENTFKDKGFTKVDDEPAHRSLAREQDPTPDQEEPDDTDDSDADLGSSDY